MSEQKDLEKNALATSLSGAWARFRQGRLIGFKWLALLLVAVTALGLWWYISSARKAENSRLWVLLDEANTREALEELVKTHPNTIQARIARLDLARYDLGTAGIDQFSSLGAEARDRAAENVEKARQAFEQLAGEFKDQPVLRVQCLLGQAKAEALLIAIPAKKADATPGSPVAPATEYKGSVPRLIELLDQVAAEAAPDTPWATRSKRLADALRTDPDNFARIQRALVELPGPTLPKGPDMPGPLGPFPPGDPDPAGGPVLPKLP
jgi:hypothetical protein